MVSVADPDSGTPNSIVLSNNRIVSAATKTESPSTVKLPLTVNDPPTVVILFKFEGYMLNSSGSDVSKVPGLITNELPERLFLVVLNTICRLSEMLDIITSPDPSTDKLP